MKHSWKICTNKHNGKNCPLNRKPHSIICLWDHQTIKLKIWIARGVNQSTQILTAIIHTAKNLRDLRS